MGCNYGDDGGKWQAKTELIHDMFLLQAPTRGQTGTQARRHAGTQASGGAASEIRDPRFDDFGGRVENSAMQAARDKQSGGGGKLCWEVGQRKQAQVRHTC